MNQIKEKFQIRNWELVSINPNKKNWEWGDYFCFWAVSFQSVIGFSLIASFYLLYDLNTVIVLLGCFIAVLLTYFFSNLIGKISQISGLSFPVILRMSMGFNGARYLGMIRGLVGIVMFGVQTYFISKSVGYLIRIFLYKIDSNFLDQEIFLLFFFGMNIIDWISFLISLIFQFLLFSKGQEFIRSFIKFSSTFVYIGLSIFLIILISENLDDLINSLKLSLNLKNIIAKNNILPLISIAGTMFAYFAIMILNFGDFSRYAKDLKQMKIGNLMLLVNLLFFSFFSILIVIGSDIILTKNLIAAERILTNPTDIIGKFDNTYLTVIALLFILTSSLSTNLVANYVPSQNTLINFLPNSLNIKKTGILIIFFGLIIGMLWLPIFSQNKVMLIVNTIASFFGPIFGIIICDYYFIKRQNINHKELFYPKDDTIYIYSGGWNYKGLYSIIIGFVFSATTVWNMNFIILQSYGWIIGAFVAFIIYYLLNNK